MKSYQININKFSKIKAKNKKEKKYLVISKKQLIYRAFFSMLIFARFH